LGRVLEKKTGLFSSIQLGKQAASKKYLQPGANGACRGAHGAHGSSKTSSCANGSWPGA